MHTFKKAFGTLGYFQLQKISYKKNITYSKRPEEHDAKNNNKKADFGENRMLMMSYIQSRQIKRKQNEFVLPVHYWVVFF